MQNIVKRFQQYTIIQYLIILIGAAILLLPSTSRAQGSLQINVTGIPPVLSSPYIDALEQNYSAGMYTMQINFSAGGTAPVAFQFRIEGYYNGELIVEAESNPTSFTPGFHSFSDIFQRISFPYSFEELLNNRASDQFQNIVQSGTLPEGTYNLVVRAEPIGFETNVTTIPANVIFQVRYP